MLDLFFDFTRQFNGKTYYFVADTVINMDLMFIILASVIAITGILMKSKRVFIAFSIIACLFLSEYTAILLTKDKIVYNFEDTKNTPASDVKNSEYINTIFFSRIRSDFSYQDLLKVFPLFPPANSKDVQYLESIKNKSPNVNQILMGVYSEGISDVAKNPDKYHFYSNQYRLSLIDNIKKGDIKSLLQVSKSFFLREYGYENVLDNAEIINEFAKNTPMTCENAAEIYTFSDDLSKELSGVSPELGFTLNEAQHSYIINSRFAMQPVKDKINTYAVKNCIDLYNKYN